jgi:tetrahydromethanopterin S-methyltransferase subunit G
LNVDPEANHLSEWLSVLKEWQATLRSDGYWTYLASLEELPEWEPCAGEADFKALRDNCWYYVLKPHIDLADLYRGKKNFIVLKQHLKLVESSGFPSRVIDEVKTQILDPIEAQVERLCSELSQRMEAESEFAVSGEACKFLYDEIYSEFETDILPLVEGIAYLRRNSDKAADIARRKAASTLRELAILYNNKAGEYIVAKEILEKAFSLAEGTPLGIEIKRDLTVISSNALHQQATAISVACNEIVENLEVALESAGSLQEKKLACGVAHEQFRTAVLERLSKLFKETGEENEFPVGFAGEDDELAIERDLEKIEIKNKILEIAASCLRHIAIAYNNEAREYSTAKSLLEEAKSLLPEGHPIREEIQESLATVSANALVEHSQQYRDQVVGRASTGIWSRFRWLAWVGSAVVIYLLFVIFHGNNGGTLPENVPNADLDVLRTEIEEAKKRLAEYERQMNLLSSEIESYKEEIDSYAHQIKAMEADLNAGYEIDRAEYESLIQSHNHVVDLHNGAVNELRRIYFEYEKLLNETNQKIRLYNEQIKSAN